MSLTTVVAAAAAVAVAAVDDNWRRKRPATRASGGRVCGRGYGGIADQSAFHLTIVDH